MPSERNPFRGIQVASSCGVIFGVISVLIGIAYLIVWLAALGVFGPDVFLYTDGSKVRLSIGESHGGISGSVLVILSACGLWCGLWMTCAGACGCSMKLGKPADQIRRTRIVVLMACAFNALLFCPIQIALYGYLFQPVSQWGHELDKEQSHWWTTMFQAIGIGSGLASLIICIVTLVIACRTKPYAGQAKTWSDFDI